MAKSKKSVLGKILGVSKTKRKIAKATGIPTTKSGRKRKIKNKLNPFK